MHEKLRALIERRIIEAGEKKVTTKLYHIAKYLGHPIIEHYNTANYMQDVWKLPEEDEMPELADADWNQDQKGFYYDGLKCGVNFCVKALVYEDQLHEVKLSYNGYLVYHEEEGRLMAYAPFPEWERHLEMFYEAALSKEQRTLRKAKEEKIEQKRKRGETFFDRIRMLWGI